MESPSDIDLDVLRGWDEHDDEALRQKHRLPALARLVRLDGPSAGRVEPVCGPEVLMGRYHPQHGPVDLMFEGLEDYELYRLGAPHLHLSMDDEAQWKLRAISPSVDTRVNGTLIDHPAGSHPIEHQDELSLGRIQFRFETADISLSSWEQARLELLEEVESPALFLLRRGGPCGPFKVLDERTPSMVGRSFPAPGSLPGRHSWDSVPPPDWDLAGLYEFERKYIGFEHIGIEYDGDQWQIEPLSTRRKTFVNRHEILEPTALASGDEIALGTVLLVFHEPAAEVQPARKGIEPPAVVDWQEGSTPILDEAPDEPAEPAEPEADSSAEESP